MATCVNTIIDKFFFFLTRSDQEPQQCHILHEPSFMLHRATSRWKSLTLRARIAVEHWIWTRILSKVISSWVLAWWNFCCTMRRSSIFKEVRRLIHQRTPRLKIHSFQLKISVKSRSLTLAMTLHLSSEWPGRSDGACKRRSESPKKSNSRRIWIDSSPKTWRSNWKSWRSMRALTKKLEKMKQPRFRNIL